MYQTRGQEKSTDNDKFWRTDKNDMITEILFDRGEMESVGIMLEDMYSKRKRIIASKKRTIRNRTQN